MAFRAPNQCEKHKQIVLDMAARGESLTRIAAFVSTNRRHVKSFLKKNGVVRKTGYGSPGSKHPAWKGGVSFDKQGYVLVYAPAEPGCRKNGRILEHRMVMQRHLGRALKKGEVVHHKNDNRQDNRIENLELFSANSEHLRKTISGQKPKWSNSGIRRMKEGIARSAMKRRPQTRVRSGQDVRAWI